MRVFFWGTYTVAEGYPVNRVLIKGLRQAGAQVEECREELWEGFLHRTFRRKKPGTYLGLGWRALRLYLRLLRRFLSSGKHQCIIVGYAGYFDIVLARLLNLWGRRPLVLVAFISLYDTIVVDRQQLAAASWQAACLKMIDRLAFSCADIVLVDTREQIDYFAALFALPREKFRRSSWVRTKKFSIRRYLRGAVQESCEYFFLAPTCPCTALSLSSMRRKYCAPTRG